MDEYVKRPAHWLFGSKRQLKREFEARLVDSSALAFRVAFGVLRQRQDAEQVVQDAFVQAHRGFRQLRDRDRFRTWLVSITWRLAVDREQATRQRAPRQLAQGGPLSNAAQAGDERQRIAELWQAIDALPDRLRLVTVLSGIEGHDVRRVALLLGVEEGAVGSRLFFARRRLKEHLQWTITDSPTR
jgi:RNA polymerase sigma-70 factor (ECF subfamily)